MNSRRHSIVSEDLREISECGIDWARFRGKTVLVTGASGFLPAYMVETLLFLNETEAIRCKIIGVVRDVQRAAARFCHYLGRPDLALIKADVSQPLELETRCDFVVHAASPASPKYYGVDPVGTMTANLMGSYYLLNLARKWNSEGFLFFSSGEVYGQVSPDKIPTRENEYGFLDILNPRSSYAESKRASETLAVSYSHQFAVPCKIVRPFHTYGPGMSLNDGRVFADFVNDLVHRRNLCLRSDGKAIRAFCYLSDGVTAYFRILLNGLSGQAYNAGNPSAAVSIGGLAEILVSLFPHWGLKVDRLDEPTENYLPSPVSVNVPNVDRLTALGWQAKHDIRDGFSRTVRSFLPDEKAIPATSSV